MLSNHQQIIRTSLSTEDLHNKVEPNPDPAKLTGEDLTRNVSSGVDYEPYPEKSLVISKEHEQVIKHITNLYCGSASEDDMQVYAEKAIYDDPYSYCDTRYKIAGQWYGRPKVFSKLRILKTQVVEDKPDLIVFKFLVSLGLDGHGKVRYHKDMWNEKVNPHEGLGKLLKKLNGDHLTKITQPPETL